MEGRVKTRQPGSITNNFGRQVGVLPISDGTKLRRGNGDQIPIGGTDISPDTYHSYQKRPPSGSSRAQASSSKTSSGKSRRIHSENEIESMYADSPISVGADKRSQSSRNVAISSRGQSSKVTSNPLKKSPGSSHSISSQYGEKDHYESQKTASARSTTSSRVPSSHTSTASSRSVATRTSPGTSSAKRSVRGTSGTTLNRKDQLDSEHIDGQDVRFTDVPSQRSKSGWKG